MKYNFKSRNENKGTVRLYGQQMLKRENFQYLGLIIHKDREIKEDINHRIRIGWMKWRGASRVLYDRRIRIKRKRKFYETVIKPTIFCGTECWAIRK